MGALSDSDILEIFYNTCNGDNWDANTHWLNASVSLCDWEGIDCTDSGDKVKLLELQDSNVVCSLPSELFLLSELCFWISVGTMVSRPIFRFWRQLAL